MDQEATLLRRIEGKHTIETFMKQTALTKESALNLLSLLRKKGYVRTEGGGKQKRLYTISLKRIQEGTGLFTLLNKYAKIKVVPSFVHIAHGKYTEENALIDAIETKDFRTLQAAIYLFGHITNWTTLHTLAKKKHLEPVVGALYDFARMVVRTRKMPEHVRQSLLRKRPNKKIKLIPHTQTDSSQIKAIEHMWNVTLPFSKQDQEEMR